VYPPLCICCVYCIVYPLLYQLLCICHCISAAVYPPLCIRRGVSAAAAIVLCILNYFCISAAMNMYPDLVLYTRLYIWHCIYICHGTSKSTTVSTVLYICHGVSATVSAVLYSVPKWPSRPPGFLEACKPGLARPPC